MARKRNRPLTLAQTSFLAVFEAYLAAPREERDQMLVGELCRRALDDLILEALERQFEED